MTDDDDEDWDDDEQEPLEYNEMVTRELVLRHRHEYEQLLAGHRIAELQRDNAKLKREIENLKAMNPDGVNVTALSETANRLATENDRLAKEFHEARQAETA